MNHPFFLTIQIKIRHNRKTRRLGELPITSIHRAPRTVGTRECAVRLTYCTVLGTFPRGIECSEIHDQVTECGRDDHDAETRREKFLEHSKSSERWNSFADIFENSLLFEWISIVGCCVVLHCLKCDD